MTALLQSTWRRLATADRNQVDTGRDWHDLQAGVLQNVFVLIVHSDANLVILYIVSCLLYLSGC